MGKRWGRKRKRSDRDERDKKTENPSKRARTTRADDHRVVVRENAAFEAYYKAQGFIPDEEWDAFMTALRSPLPTTFRVNRGGQYFELLQTRLKELSADMEGISCDGQVADPPAALSWFPSDNAWYLDVARGPIRKLPAYKKFHQFLRIHTDQGGVTRQEAVSMIPPLLLDVKENHKVLDMCAAPGSKTSQIAEAMQKDAGYGNYPSGVIVANDADEKRCYMLVHQMNRLGSPSIIVTNHEAQKFPGMSFPKDHPQAGQRYRFDRILADVPCSGDGTVRKSPDIWKKWSVKQAFVLHRLQVRIAHRGAQMLNVGGRLVYSTCSLNPIENEAVVCDLLRMCEGVLELVDVSKEIPLLKRLPGMKSWKVQYDGVWYDSHESLTEEAKRRITPSCFPPTADVVDPLHLERCIRMAPHHQNTGGFFVAVLQKVKEFDYPAETEDAVALAEAKATAAKEAADVEQEKAEDAPEEPKKYTGSKRPKREPNQKRSCEAPFLVLDMEKHGATIQRLAEFYGIEKGFNPKHILVRSEGKQPKLYLLSEQSYELLCADHLKRVRIVNMGLRVFNSHGYSDSNIEYRICFDGVHCIGRYLTPKRICPINVDDLLLLITSAYPKDEYFSPEARKALVTMESGGVIYKCDLSQFGLKPVLYAGWRGINSAHFLVGKLDIAAIKALFAPHLLEENKDARDAQAPPASPASEAPESATVTEPTLVDAS